MKYKYYVFDLDGTIYFGDKLADNANAVIDIARKNSDAIFFVTNNSAKTKQEIYQRLINLGVDVKYEEVITSSYAIARYLKSCNLNTVYCIGTASLKQELLNNGIELNNKNISTVVVGYDKDFKLDDLTELLNSSKTDDLKLIVANKERSYPSKNKVILAGAGPIVSAVECILNKQADILIGKPNKIMLELIFDGKNINPSEVCVIGDSFESDVKMAQNYGADFFWITNQQKEGYKTIKKLDELLEIL